MAEVGESPMEIESKAVQPAAVPTAPKQSGYELPWWDFIHVGFDNSGTMATWTQRLWQFVHTYRCLNFKSWPSCYLPTPRAGSRSIVQCNWMRSLVTKRPSLDWRSVFIKPLHGPFWVLAGSSLYVSSHPLVCRCLRARETCQTSLLL